MPLTRRQARVEISAIVKTATDTIAAFGVSPNESENVIWDDVQKEKPEGQNPPPTWARVSIRHADGTQPTIVGPSGQRRYTKVGVVMIQVFTPSDGLVSADSIADTLEDAFRGVDSPNGVWFRNPRSNEVGVDGPWFHTNVIVDFEYDQVT